MAQKQIRLLLFLAIPSAVGMLVLSLPIVEVLFMRKQFQPTDAIATAQVVQMYAFLLVVSSVNKVATPCFYAIKNTWLPACVSIFSLVIHYFLAQEAIQIWGLMGLVGSTVVSGLINVTLILLFVYILIGSLGVFELMKTILVLIPSLVTLGFVSHWVYVGARPVVELVLPLGGARALALGMAITIGVIVYFMLNKLLKVEEALQFFDLLKRRRKKA